MRATMRWMLCRIALTFSIPFDMGFDADMAALRYCFVCVELYRRTVQEIDANDSHLKMLYENLERNATRVLNSGRFDEDLQSHIKAGCKTRSGAKCRITGQLQVRITRTARRATHEKITAHTVLHR